MKTPRTETAAIVAALRILARDIESGDGVANAAIAEAAERLEQLHGENADLLDLVEDMAHQHCHTSVALRDYNGQVAGSMVTDSGALSVDGKALQRLADANPPRFRIVAEAGRMVVGYWPKNDPQKEGAL